jgi:hypothetical protein
MVDLTTRMRGASPKTNSITGRKGRIAVPTSFESRTNTTTCTNLNLNEDYSDYDETEHKLKSGDGGADFDPHGASSSTADGGGTITAAIFGIIKAMVGPAILYLPHSFADAGYFFALAFLLVCLCMYLYSSNRLLQTWHYVKSSQELLLFHNDKKHHTKSEDQVEMVSLVTPSSSSSNSTTPKFTSIETTTTKTASSISSENLNVNGIHWLSDDDKDKDKDNSSTPKIPPSQHHSSSRSRTTTTTTISYPLLAKIAYDDLGETCVRAGITCMQLGICLTYFIFVPHNLTASLWTLFQTRVPMWWLLAAMVLVEIPLSSVRDIRRLVHTNVLANVLIAFGLLSCLYLALSSSESQSETESDREQEETNHQLAEESEEGLSPWNDKWYLFIGTSVRLQSRDICHTCMHACIYSCPSFHL